MLAPASSEVVPDKIPKSALEPSFKMPRINCEIVRFGVAFDLICK